MSISKNCPDAGLNNTARLHSNALHPLSVSLRKSKLLSLKPRGYLLALIFFCLFAVMPAIAEAAVVYWAPWVTKTTTNSATINWYGSNSTAGNIEYDTSSYYIANGSFRHTKINEATVAYQHVQLTGLEPNTSYTYWVRPSGSLNQFTPPRTFRTMPVSGPFSFIVISDTHAQLGRFQYVAAAIAANETDVLFILDGGDYPGHDSQDEWNIYFEKADVMLAKFAIFTTIGNHEYHNSSSSTAATAAVQYHSSFDVPTNGALNHFFDCAGIRFIILASPDPLTGEDPHTSLNLTLSQAPWLWGLLKDNMAGVFTIHHHPIWDYFDPTNNPNLQPWEDLYHAYPISANFSGHTHTYQRYSVMGIPYFIVGNAGGNFSPLITNNGIPVWYVTGIECNLGYLKVTVDPANNTATAQEILIGYGNYLDTSVILYPAPITFDTITFPLKPIDGGGWGRSGNCFIATAAFGSYFDPSVKILRDFRDKFLITNHVGQSFVNWYYKTSPPLADLISTREIMKTIVRILLLPAVGFAYLCLNVGVIPTLLVLLFSTTFIYLGIRRFYRVDNRPIVKKEVL